MVLNVLHAKKTISKSAFERVYTVSPDVGKLIDGNKWMPLDIKFILRSLGISESNVVLNINDGPNELDLVANCDGAFVLMELKDDVFSIGHVYSFVGKHSQYKPDISIIIATGGLSPEVKDYIRRTRLKCYTIESIDSLEDEIKKTIGNFYTTSLMKLIARMPSWGQALENSILSYLGVKQTPEHRRFVRGFEDFEPEFTPEFFNP